MDLSWWLVQTAVFAASLLQAATGIGFGVIAGPVLLLILNNASAIQVSIILSLVIALLLAPSIFRQVDRALFKLLVYGTCAGIPLGIIVFLNIDISTLKLLAGLAVAFMALTTAGVFGSDGDSDRVTYSSGSGLSMGVISGAMSSSLGMPGPVPAAWMLTRSFGKEVIRSTILFLFIPSYLAAAAIQAAMAGIKSDTMTWSLTLLPATVAGVVIGKLLEPHINERLFKIIITLILACTAVGLFLDVLNR